MAKLTKRKIQGRETRQKIFNTSLELFTRHGYEKVTIDDICEKIGVSKGAFYTHFKSKDQVILENFIHLNSFYDDIFNELSALPTSLGKLYLFQQHVMKNIAAIGYEAVKLVYHLETTPKKNKSFLISRTHNLYKIIMSLIEEGQESGEIRADTSADMITSMLVRLYRGMILDWCLDNGGYDLVESSNDTAPFIYEAIRPPRTSLPESSRR